MKTPKNKNFELHPRPTATSSTLPKLKVNKKIQYEPIFSKKPVQYEQTIKPTNSKGSTFKPTIKQTFKVQYEPTFSKESTFKPTNSKKKSFKKKSFKKNKPPKPPSKPPTKYARFLISEVYNRYRFILRHPVLGYHLKGKYDSRFVQYL